MTTTRPILIGAIALFILLAGAGAYVLLRSPANGANVNIPSAITAFTVSGREFSVTGQNLSRIEIWAVENGKQKFLGSASPAASGQGSIGQVWTMPVPLGLHGVAGVFTRGYDRSGTAVAKMDLPPLEVRKL